VNAQHNAQHNTQYNVQHSVTPSSRSVCILSSEELSQLVVATLEEGKSEDITVLDVRGKTPLADFMVIASGNSNRHVQALADQVALAAKERGVLPLGIEGGKGQEWILVDLNDVIVHLMLPKVRDFYNLEKLWMAEEPAKERSASDESAGESSPVQGHAAHAPSSFRQW